MQALASALASGNAQAAGRAYAAALQQGGSAAAAATTVMATAIATANCNGVIVTAIASKPNCCPLHKLHCTPRALEVVVVVTSCIWLLQTFLA